MLLQCLLLFLSSKLVHQPLSISDKLILYKCNSRKQNQQDLAWRVLEQQLVARSASPAGSNSQTPPTDAVRAAERSSGGRGRHGATRQRLTERETQTGYMLQVILKMLKNVQQNKPLVYSSRVEF